MAAPGAAIGAPVIRTQSIIPLVERVGNQLDLRKRQEQARQDRINKEWTDLMYDINNNGLDTVQNNTITRQHEKVLSDYAADLKSGDGQMDYQKRLEHLRKQTMLKASADRMRAANENVQQLNASMKELGYYKNENMMRDAYNKLHQYDESTGQWVARDDVNPDEINSMLTDSRYIDGDAFFKKDLEDFEKIDMMGQQAGPFGSTLLTNIQTRDVWMRDDDGTIKRGANGEPIPDMKMLMEELMKNPDKRKIYQSLAADANQSLPNYLYDKVMANTGYSEKFQRAMMPSTMSASERMTARRQAAQDRYNLQTHNKLQDLFNQHQDIFKNAKESNISTPTGGLYDDVTSQFPFMLEKNKRPYKVLVDKDVPDTIFIVDNEGDEPRPVTREEYPNLINQIETYNPTAQKGLVDVGLREGIYNTQGQVAPTFGRPVSPEEKLGYIEQGVSLQQYRNRLKNKYKQVDVELRGERPSFWTGLGITKTKLPEARRRLSADAAKTIEDELNKDFGGAYLNLTKEQAEDLELPRSTIRNLRFEVVKGAAPRVKIYSGETMIDEMTPERFKALMETDQLIVGTEAIPQDFTPVPETADDIALPKK